MHNDRMILKKILDELISYFLRIGIKDVHIDIEDGNKKMIISIEGSARGIPKNKIDDLNVLLCCQRQDEMEGYYWELAGENDQHEELNLICMLLDNVEILHDDEENLKVTVCRNK